MNPPVQPPCANPPSRSSPACPGAWITPSSDTYSTTIKLLTRPPFRSQHAARPVDLGYLLQPPRQASGCIRAETIGADGGPARKKTGRRPGRSQLPLRAAQRNIRWNDRGHAAATTPASHYSACGKCFGSVEVPSDYPEPVPDGGSLTTSGRASTSLPRNRIRSN